MSKIEIIYARRDEDNPISVDIQVDDKGIYLDSGAVIIYRKEWSRFKAIVDEILSSIENIEQEIKPIENE